MHAGFAVPRVEWHMERDTLNTPTEWRLAEQSPSPNDKPTATDRGLELETIETALAAANIAVSALQNVWQF